MLLMARTLIILENCDEITKNSMLLVLDILKTNKQARNLFVQIFRFHFTISVVSICGEELDTFEFSVALRNVITRHRCDSQFQSKWQQRIF